MTGTFFNSFTSNRWYLFCGYFWWDKIAMEIFLVFRSSFRKVDPVQILFVHTARSPRESNLQMFGAGADFIMSSIQRVCRYSIFRT